VSDDSCWALLSKSSLIWRHLASDAAFGFGTARAMQLHCSDSFRKTFYEDLDPVIWILFNVHMVRTLGEMLL
jgi:hypothetical protein